MNNQEFIREVAKLIEKCASDRARLFFIASQVLEELQATEPNSPTPTKGPTP